MMKKNFSVKSFVSGVLVTTMLFACVTTATAAFRTKQATLTYPGIKISLNGQTVTAKTESGAAIEPFSIDGTTYLPVRGVASVLGVDVGWDQATKTVLLNTGSIATGSEIANKDGIKVYFEGFAEPSGYIGDAAIKVKVVNGSEKDVTVQVRDLSVNGVMAESIFSCTVAAGKSANDEILLYNLEKSGISTPVKTAEFYITVFDDNYKTLFDTDVIKLG